MADKMMRIAGRDGDGFAKALRADEGGGIFTRPAVGSNRLAYPITEPKLLDIPTYDGTGKAVHPTVLYIPEKFGGFYYWMAMTPFANSNANLENPSILCSNDGVNWTVPVGVTNPLFGPPPSGYYADPLLMYKWDTKQLYLYWCHFGAGADKGYVSISSDGKVWSEAIETSHYFSGFGMSYVATNLWYGQAKLGAGFAGTLSGGHPEYTNFISTDGINFIQHTPSYSNLPGGQWHASRAKMADGYHYITSVNGISDNGRNEGLSLYYGYSPDGQAVLFDSTPLFAIDPSKFPNVRWYHSCIVPFASDSCRVYFSGLDSVAGWRIGYFDVVLNNPAWMYAQTDYAKSRTRSLFYRYELRTTEYTSYIPPAGPSTRRGIPEFSTHKNKVLMCLNTLKDAEGGNVAVTISIMLRDKEVGGTTHGIILPPSVPQTITITTDIYNWRAITPDVLPVLGYKLPGVAWVQLKADKVAASGEFTLILQTSD